MNFRYFKFNRISLFNFVDKNANNTKDSSDPKNSNHKTQEDKDKVQKKEPKHIFNKQTKKDDQEILVDEVHTYRERVDDGFYSKERMSSYVFYEAPKGASSESGGKSQKTQNEDNKQENTKKEETTNKEKENIKTDEGKKL